MVLLSMVYEQPHLGRELDSILVQGLHIIPDPAAARQDLHLTRVSQDVDIQGLSIRGSRPASQVGGLSIRGSRPASQVGVNAMAASECGAT